MQSELLQSKHILQILKKDLLENEKVAVEGRLLMELIERTEAMIPLNIFSEEIQNKVEEFLTVYHKAIRVSSCVLAVDKIITILEDVLAKSRQLVTVLLSEKFSEPLIKLLKDYQKTLESRLTALANDKKSAAEIAKSLKSKVIFLTTSSKGQKRVLIQCPAIPEPLQGASNLLNYQIFRFVEVADIFMQDLGLLIQNYGLKELHVKNVQDQGELDSFVDRVKQDKIVADKILQKNGDVLNSEESMNNIMSNLASDLLYRIAWDQEFKLLAETAP